MGPARSALEDIHHEVICQHEEMLYGILHALPDASYGDLVGLLVQGKADHHIEIVFDFSNDLSPGSKKFGMHPVVNIRFLGNAFLKFLHDV